MFRVSSRYAGNNLGPWEVNQNGLNGRVSVMLCTI